MRRRLALVALALVLGIAVPAHAGLSVSAAAGTGYQLDGGQGRIRTHLMLAPGLDVLDELLRFDVAVLADLPDVKDTAFDLQLRAGLILELPYVPLYVRGLVGMSEVLHGPLTFLFGGGLGADVRVGDFTGAFAEVVLAPRATSGTYVNVVEGRLGLYFVFE